MATVQTVLGPVSSNLLGRTLTHEHFALDFQGIYIPPPDDLKPFLNKRLTLQNVGFIRQYPFSNVDNCRLGDEDARDAFRRDLELFKKFGGATIVENSSHGLKRNLDFMLEISNALGIHVVAGTGHYVHNFQTPEHLNMKVEEMTDLYSKEIITGVETEGKQIVKCGFIGEVGSGWPLHDFEKHAICATGEIQEVLGCGVSFHPGRDPEAPFEIVRLYLEAGGRADKCIMSHLDRTICDIDQLLEFAKLGTNLQFDLFGMECSYYQLNPEFDMPSDGQRINNLMRLIAEGLEDRIFMSHDVGTKHRLTTFGGHGFHHIYTNVLPKMHVKGLTVEQAEKITVTNPAKWLELKV